MGTRPTLVWIVSASLLCLSGGLFVAFLAQDLYPNHAGPIVLAGVPIVGLPLGLVGAGVLLRGGRQQFATHLRTSERAICLACMVASVGSLLGTSGRGLLGIIGGIASVCGTLAAAWFLLKAVPARGRP